MSANEARAWWAGRRKLYNIGLVVAGILAFALYAVAFQVRCLGVPEAEITLFTTLFQGIGYLIAMAFANLCYNLGYLVERLLKPTNTSLYRKVSFWAGFAFSVTLPFLIPAATFAFGCVPGPEP
jgi:hypothetical protein